MSKTEKNSYRYTEHCPDPTAGAAIKHIEAEAKKKRKTVNSRQKGARYERELAAAFRDQGFDARRGQQYCGANGDADVVGLPGIHVEAKRVEKLNLYDAMAQARRDARSGEIPAVFHRKSNCGTLVTLEIDGFFEVSMDWLLGKLAELEGRQ